ncbi:hypothetical protein GWI33_010217, partial [Rhynchophorus ferrugineus]
MLVDEIAKQLGGLARMNGSEIDEKSPITSRGGYGELGVL